MSMTETERALAEKLAQMEQELSAVRGNLRAVTKDRDEGKIRLALTHEVRRLRVAEPGKLIDAILTAGRVKVAEDGAIVATDAAGASLPSLRAGLVAYANEVRAAVAPRGTPAPMVVDVPLSEEEDPSAPRRASAAAIAAAEGKHSASARAAAWREAMPQPGKARGVTTDPADVPDAPPAPAVDLSRVPEGSRRSAAWAAALPVRR